MSDLQTLNDRARRVFQQIVENYLETGDPIGSKTLSSGLGEKISPASIRSTMAELETLGLLYAPHISAGRLPTEQGLRLFVDGLLQVGDLSEEERAAIAPQISPDTNLNDVVTKALEGLSGISSCAGLVMVPQSEETLRHIEFIPISQQQLLVVLVDARNQVENRIINWPRGVTHSNLTAASNYLNSRLTGKSLQDVRRDAVAEISKAEAELDNLTAQVVEAGLAEWAGHAKTGKKTGKNEASVRQSSVSVNDPVNDKSLIIRGQAHLLDNVEAMEDLERIRILLDDLERKKELIHLLSNAEEGEGVRIFIGSETKLFSLSGSSLIVSGYRDKNLKILGVLGVIAPTRSNYARLIPLVDHTARVVSKVLGLSDYE
jgi:heat-inducible transcriptional repressor